MRSLALLSSGTFISAVAKESTQNTEKKKEYLVQQIKQKGNKDMEHVMLESWRGFLEKEDSKEEDKYIYIYGSGYK